MLEGMIWLLGRGRIEVYWILLLLRCLLESSSTLFKLRTFGLLGSLRHLWLIQWILPIKTKFSSRWVVILLSLLLEAAINLLLLLLLSRIRKLLLWFILVKLIERIVWLLVIILIHHHWLRSSLRRKILIWVINSTHKIIEWSLGLLLLLLLLLFLSH